jgi:hypothetical protein
MIHYWKVLHLPGVGVVRTTELGALVDQVVVVLTVKSVALAYQAWATMAATLLMELSPGVVAVRVR